MFGIPFEDKVAEQQAILSKAFSTAGITPTGLAIDLGSGPGFQAFALANLGFTSILAVDTSAALIAELESHRTDSHRPAQPIRTITDDIRALPVLAAPLSAKAIVCMGDTLTHLPAKSDIIELFSNTFTALAPGGILILTWRDLTPELTGPDRFIPVRATDDTIMTCFLDYATPDTVQVHDLVHKREAGAWSLNKSSYPKLRLSPAFLTEQLTQAGFKVHPQTTAGRLLLLAATKP
jgi:SAM-dependent methyltransferase